MKDLKKVFRDFEDEINRSEVSDFFDVEIGPNGVVRWRTNQRVFLEWLQTLFDRIYEEEMGVENVDYQFEKFWKSKPAEMYVTPLE